MHDHPRLAGARPGEHEVVALERRGDDGLLLGVGELGEDAAVCRLGGRHLEHVLAPGEVAAHELGPVEAEVIDDEGHRRLDLADRKLGVLGHHVHLDGLVLVVQGEFGVVGLLELAPTRLGFELDVHRRAEHRLAARQVQDLVGVQVQQRGRQRHVPFVDVEIGERGVGLQRRFEFALLAGHEQRVALAAALELGHQCTRQAHAAFADGLDLPPAAQQPDEAAVRRMRTQSEEAAVGGTLAEGLGEGFQQAGEAIGVEVDLGVAAQGVAQAAHVEDLPPLLGGIGGGFAQLGDEGVLDARELIEPLRGVGVAVEGDADLGVVRQQLPAVELAQHVLQRARVLAGGEHQLVGGHALVVRGADEQAENAQIWLDVRVGAELPAQEHGRLVLVRHQQAAGKHAGLVLVALEQARLLEPGDRDPHLGVGVARIRVDAVGLGDLEQDLAAGHHHLAFAAVLALDGAQRLEDGADVVLGEAGVAQQAELHVEVGLVVEQDAARRRLVTPGAAGLLEIVFQRAGGVEVDHQAHVGLVHPHAEGVGGRDHPQAAGQEGLLHRALVGRQHAAVKVAAGEACVLEELRELLDRLLARAEDDGAAVLAQGLLQQAQDLAVLGLHRHRAHLVAEVFAAHPAFEALEAEAEALLEVSADVIDHIRLGGGGETEHRRGRGLLPCLDEARHVQVIGPKIVPPLRQAVRLVEHPGADLAVHQRAGESGAAKLLRRDEDQPEVAQAQLVEHGAALERVEQIVEVASAGDAARLQVVDLVLHQRLQRRDHHRQAAVAVEARQRRQLEAQRLAAARGQDGERRPAGKTVLDDHALQRMAIRRGRRGAKAGDAGKVARQQRLQVMLLAAPGAGRIGARPVAQHGDDFAHARKAEAHPGRQHRIATRHAQPGQRVGQRLVPGGIGQAMLDDVALPGDAHLAGGRALPGCGRIRERGPERAAQGGEQVGHALAVLRREQEVQAQAFVGMIDHALLQRLALVEEEFVSQLRVAHRIVARGGAQLVVLHQAVIGVLRKRDRRQLQRVDQRQAVQGQPRMQCRKRGLIEGDDVVAEDEGGAFGQGIEPADEIGRLA